jgi:hypothetical protein
MTACYIKSHNQKLSQNDSDLAQSPHNSKADVFDPNADSDYSVKSIK